MRRTNILVLTAIVAMPVAGMAQGYDVDAAMKQAERLQQQYGQGEKTAASELPEIIELKESDITRFAKTMTELQALGIKFDSKNSKQGPARTMEAIEGNSTAMGVVRKNRFTTDRLSQVAYSVAMALAALDFDKDAAKNARTQSEQALQSARDQLSAEQLAMMKQHMATSMKSLDQFEDQPKRNLELVAKHRKALEASFEASKPRKKKSK